MKWVKASERLPNDNWYGPYKFEWPDVAGIEHDTGNTIAIKEINEDSNFINLYWLDESDEPPSSDNRLRDALQPFAKVADAIQGNPNIKDGHNLYSYNGICLQRKHFMEAKAALFSQVNEKPQSKEERVDPIEFAEWLFKQPIEVTLDGSNTYEYLLGDGITAKELLTIFINSKTKQKP